MRLPRGWSEVPIEDVLASLEDGRPIHQGWSPQCEKEPSQSDDAWGVLKTTAIQAGEFHPEHNKLLPTKLEPRPLIEVHEGDLLLTCAGPRARCGVPCLVRSTRPHLMLSGKMYRFRTPEEHLSARYLESFLRSRDAQVAINRMKTGISDSGLNLTQKRFKQLAVPIAPRLEQERIVEAIESYLTRLDDAVASLERVQRNLERYRASVLKAAVEGRLVPTEAQLARQEGRDYEPASELLKRILAERKTRWIEDAVEKARAKANSSAGALLEARKQAEKKYKEPEPPDLSALQTQAGTTDLPALPEGWCWASVEQLASDQPRSIQSGPFGSSLLHSEFQEKGKLVIGIDNVQDGFFSPGAQHRISEEKFEALARFSARPGDVLVTVMATIGRCCVVPDPIEPAIITKHVYRISPDNEAVLSRYLLTTLRAASVVREQMFGQVRGQTRPGLNGTIIKALAIPLPSPSEQTRIIAEAERLLSKQEVLIASLEQAISHASRLRQSILKWAFEGKLVEQVPSDEPASVLLERIRTQHIAGARQ